MRRGSFHSLLLRWHACYIVIICVYLGLEFTLFPWFQNVTEFPHKLVHVLASTTNTVGHTNRIAELASYIIYIWHSLKTATTNNIYRKGWVRIEGVWDKEWHPPFPFFSIYVVWKILMTMPTFWRKKSYCVRAHIGLSTASLHGQKLRSKLKLAGAK